MIDNGARSVVLTSRNPQISDAWVEEQHLRGATVKVFSNDITVKGDVELSLINICETMPAIGGVVNGAIVLREKLFASMDLDDWLAATKPKIDKSRHLDELFASDKSLEFFINLLLLSLETAGKRATMLVTHTAAAWLSIAEREASLRRYWILVRSLGLDTSHATVRLSYRSDLISSSRYLNRYFIKCSQKLLFQAILAQVASQS